ncbi:hypothetical protein ACFWFR_07945 [Oerskovia sp. NPDC060287]|uniref:hypothetical protein n=1 Tax=Oerskovia sp. NPDC060287 TaxID=3347095 RepID=UPI00364D3EE3
MAAAMALAVLLPTAATASTAANPVDPPPARTTAGVARSTIQGSVLDAAGNPATGVTVAASAPGEHSVALVGDDGSFVIDVVDADTDHVLYLAGLPGIYTPMYLTFASGVWTTQGDASAATPVRGGSSAIDVRLAPAPRISGTLRDSDGVAIDGQWVQLQTETGDWAGSTLVKEGGAFSFDGLGPARTYVLWVEGYGDPRFISGYVRISDDGSASLVRDRAEASPVLTGTLGLEVTVGRTGGFSGVVTGTSSDQELLSLTLHASDGTTVGWPQGERPGADGRFALYSAPGTYRIGVNRQSGISRYAATYFSATKAQGVSTVAEASPVLLTAGEITPGVDVELRECASVSGKVTGWVPPYAMVTVYDDENPDVATRQAIVQPDGTYTVTGLVPARYHMALDYFADSESGTRGKVFLGGGATEPERTRLDVARCAPVKGVNIKVTVPRLEVTEAPVVSGVPVVGAELAATSGTWTLPGALAPSEPTNVQYRWLRDGKVVKGATSATYQPVRADIGKSLSVRVTAELTGFRKGSTTSGGTAPVVAAAPGS